MARPPKAIPAHAPDTTDEARLEQAGRAAQELTVIQREANESANSLAHQLGYDGSLTVGAIEDEIRFYQRQTVAAMLELGKRLLILKELTPHGEFAARVDLLGFAERSARRFMQAAAKASKSATVADLAGRVKNQKAFLELIMHDDDVIENLAEMDHIDKMSASEVRSLARNLQEDLKQNEKLLGEKTVALNKAKRRLHEEEPDAALTGLLKEVLDAEMTATANISGTLRKGFAKVIQHDDHYGTNSKEVLSGYLLQIEVALQDLREEFGITRALTDKPDWMVSAPGEPAIDKSWAFPGNAEAKNVAPAPKAQG